MRVAISASAASDPSKIEARQILAMRQRLNGTFAHATGQALEKISRDTERNHWMTAKEARDYGLVGSIVESSADFMKAQVPTT